MCIMRPHFSFRHTDFYHHYTFPNAHLLYMLSIPKNVFLTTNDNKPCITK